MKDIRLAKDALANNLRNYHLNFDERLIIIRRNLLFVSMLSFAALAVSPKGGSYSVNLGVISGVVEQPAYIFGGLLSVCAYQLYHFWVNCRQSVFNFSNFGKVEEAYMFELASVHAFVEWNNLVKQYITDKTNMAIGTFSKSPKSPREQDRWKVRQEIQLEHLHSKPEFVKALESSSDFQLGESRGFSQIDYMYAPVPDDYVFLNIHRDHFWLAKKKEFIEYGLPVIVGYLALVSSTYKVASLLW